MLHTFRQDLCVINCREKKGAEKQKKNFFSMKKALQVIAISTQYSFTLCIPGFYLIKMRRKNQQIFPF